MAHFEEVRAELERKLAKMNRLETDWKFLNLSFAHFLLTLEYWAGVAASKNFDP